MKTAQDRNPVPSSWPARLAAGGLFFASAAAHAYIGPGAGLSAIGSLLALIAAVFVAIFGFLWYPIKSWRRRRQAAAAPAQPQSATRVDAGAGTAAGVRTDAGAEPPAGEPAAAARERAEPEQTSRQ